MISDIIIRVISDAIVAGYSGKVSDIIVRVISDDTVEELVTS